MSYQFKALKLSFAIHALVAMFIIGISHSIPMTQKTIVIDFSIEDSAVSNQQSAISSQKPAVRSQKSEVREQKPKIEKIEQKTETPISDTQMVSISENQVPVLPTSSAGKDEDGGNGIGKTDGSSEGIRTGSIIASDGGAGDTVEKLRMKYFKEHFTYIRDMILKNLSYPHMARKMGWEGKVTVSFIVCESGYAENTRVIGSSGFDVLDKNAIETVKRASPFPRPPVRAELIIPITYKLVSR